MAWVAVAAAAVTVGGNYLLNSGSGGGSGTNSPAQAADPFASQRYQYQGILKNLMDGQGTKSGDQQAQDAMKGMALSQSSPMWQGFNSMAQMLQPGNNFQPADPSYKFRFDQGMEAVNRSAAKGGMLGSGNQMAELMQFGQGMASQEFGAEFARQQALTGQAAQLQQQQFGMLSTVDQNQQNIFQNNYARLAQLAGANSGQPGQAGQLMASQQAGASAALQQFAPVAVQGAQSLWNWASGSSANAGATADPYNSVYSGGEPDAATIW